MFQEHFNVFSNGKDIRTRGFLIPSVPQAAKICVKNLHIILQENLEVVSIIDIAKHNSGKVYVDNMLITTKSIEAGINSAIFTQAAQTNKFMVDGCVVCFSDKSYYYGSDFSGFYVDYKTGRLGLKALSGKGFYQGKVTEEYLISKGYRKKAI